MQKSSILYFIAAGLSVLGAAAHEIAGSPKVLGPLADSNLPKDVIWLHHFSWHVGTVSVLAMAALFIAASRAQSGRLMAMIATAMSLGFAVLAIGLAVLGDSVVWTTPAPYPWTVIAALGFIGVLMHPKTETHLPE